MIKEFDAPYTKFALPYSVTNEAYFSEKMSELVLSLLPSNATKVNHMIDIACGVGTACFYFFKKGFQVTGMDISPNMLINAKEKAAKLGYPIEFIQQDMKEFSYNKNVELVTCMYDSLNFMTSHAELFEVFARIFKSLNQNGLFIFDIYTVLGLSDCWGNQEQIHTNEPHHFIATKTTWDADNHLAIKTLYGFSQVEDVWHRWQERHKMRAFPLEEIKSLLVEVGFSSVDIFGVDNFVLAKLTDSVKRALIVAQKN